jgi:NitT/TauT family transport system substrate-binding protein
MNRFDSSLLTRRPARIVRRAIAVAAAALAVGFATAPAYAAAPLKIGYSDWPGFVAFQIAIDKGWFKEAGVDVDFEWFDYSASLDAFSAGKLDAVGATNGDALVTGATGAKNVMFLLTDYSSGNDTIIAKPAVKSVKDLKGKKVGVEVGLVDHLLLDTALEKNGLKESDVTLVNAKTNELPQVLASSKDIAAIGAWQPSAGEACTGLACDLHVGRRPGPDLRRHYREPGQPVDAQGRLGQGPEGLVSLRGLRQRPEDPGGRGQDHVRA